MLKYIKLYQELLMIKKSLDSQNILIKEPNFPIELSSKGGHRALLGIGGNIGDVIRRFNHLLIYLFRSSVVEVVESSPILRNPPFGYIEQSDFYNALILIETKLTPKELLRYILRVEKRFGRRRSFANAPRTLDIDMIYYEKVKMQTKRLTLPHSGAKSRDSILIPLSMMRNKI